MRFEQLPFATIDHLRPITQGHQEVIFCPGKTVGQVVAIAERLDAAGSAYQFVARQTVLEYKLAREGRVARCLRVFINCASIIGGIYFLFSFPRLGVFLLLFTWAIFAPDVTERYLAWKSGRALSCDGDV